MLELATQYGRYGYRRVTELLRQRGWKENHKRTEHLWRQEGLKVPRKTVETKMFVVQRWFMRPSSPITQRPCLKL